ncbi:hypothetical protein [Taibaiella koreensis]|uniref:hypothetical protein n=1 Tax=Taibaiella koreensis TaxID=1268548 RepID=UPI000E59A8A5|nr:hypothetical protein [Taibaiella koreensis]
MTKNYLLLLAALPFLLISCQQKMYFPERANTPGLTEALEGKATLSFKPQTNDIDSGNSKGGIISPAFDIAFAPANHFGIIASYRSTLNRYIKEESGTFLTEKNVGGKFNGHRFEFGVGYFNTFGSRGKAEVYVGYGNGTLERRGIRRLNYDYNTRYHRYFIQPAIGFGSDKISFTAGLRFSVHKYYDFKPLNDPELVNYIAGDGANVENNLFPFVEPFVNFEFGSPYVKFNIQAGFGTQMTQDNRVSGTAPMFISFGVVGHYAPRFFKQSKSSERE